MRTTTFPRLRALALACATLLAPVPALAQALTGGIVLNGGVPSYNVNATAPFTIDQATMGLRVTCVSGCAGGGGGGTSGSVTAAGTNGTTAQAVQGIAGGIPFAVTGTFWQATQPVSLASAPLPTNAAQADKQDTGNTSLGTISTSNTSIATATGAQADAATASGANTSIVGALRAIRDKLLGTLTTTTTITASSTDGTTADAAYTGSGNAGVISILKGIYTAPYVPFRSAGTNRSATVSTTASTIMAANTARSGWKAKNDCTVAVVINFDATATNAAGSGNIQIAPGAYLASEPGFVEIGAMSAIAASGTCALTVREQ